MKAVQFSLTIPRYAAGLALGKLIPAALWGGLSCTALAETPEPDLPDEEWVKVRTIYGGICGSDLSAITLKASPFYSAVTSFPYTFGHENVGRIAAVGSRAGDWQVGERIVVEPLLWCRPRGFSDLCPACARGEINRCERTAEGKLATGLFTGFCRTTGGSWSAVFVAHTAQLFRVPETLSDENALMVEPFACGLHAVLQNPPGDHETVLIVGAGTMGLCTLAALRALGSQGRILVMARHPFQAEAARKLGASEVILTGRRGSHYERIAQLTGGALHTPLIGKPAVIGGADRTFVCVGSDAGVDDGLRLTRHGGRVVLVSVPGIAKAVDWTPVFVQELEMHAAYAYHHAETYQGRACTTFDAALDLMTHGQVDLGWLVTHRFSLGEYGDAFRLFTRRSQSQTIKAVFSFD